MTQGRTVKVIPATLGYHTGKPKASVQKRRVAGYARVSTDSDEQFTSYEAQIDYYTQMIKRRADWEFVDVYTDEGISGTNTKHRAGFNRMIEDALNGKIDLIITKSVSRFARNTVDSLVTVRKLKEKGVEVYFEKENIYTLDSKGELLITIMSSLAQEESRSISENVTWGHRKRFQDGKVLMAYGNMLGYRKGKDGQPEIVEEEAEVIRYIYREFLSGTSYQRLADDLTAKGIKTPRGKTKWCSSVVFNILQNEKYKGAAYLQKWYTTDFLTKKQKRNEGEVPKYYVENSHPAIIDPKMWEMVQTEVERRRHIGKKYSGKSVFASRIICGDCGAGYVVRNWKTVSGDKRAFWYCADRYEKENACKGYVLDEEELKEKFTKAANQIFNDKEVVLEKCRKLLAKLEDTSELDRRLEDAFRECEVLSKLHDDTLKRCADPREDQVSLAKKADGYLEAYEEKQAEIITLNREKERRDNKAKDLSGFMFKVHEQEDLIEEFDERLWSAMVDKVVVSHSGKLTFQFRNGTKIKV